MIEQFPHESTKDEQYSRIDRRKLGETALGDEQTENLFAVTDKKLMEILPIVNDAKTTIGNLLRAFNPAQSNQGTVEQENVEVKPTPSQPSRQDKRVGKSIYAKPISRVIRTGAMYIASFDDNEEGTREGREIFPDDFDDVLGNIYESRIVAAAEPLRQVRLMGERVAADIETLNGQDPVNTMKRYQLLKALAYGPNGKSNEKDDGNYDRLSLPAVVTTYVAIAGHNLKNQLSAEVEAGVFDAVVALDVMRYSDQAINPEPDYQRIRQLAIFGAAIAGDQSQGALYNLMAANLDVWPASQRQVVFEARSDLIGRLGFNLDRIDRILRQEDLIGVSDTRETFQAAVNALSDEVLRRAPVVSSNKADIMWARASLKRGRQTSRRQRNSTPVSEEMVTTSETDRHVPLRLVTCNLNNYSVTDGVDGMIDEFVRTTSQGSVTVRADVERIVNFLARTDLPPEHRRGVKTISGAKVRFGTDEDPDKLWDFYELKPSEAAGLSTRTAIAKALRVYFIKMGDNKLGIIGIKPRADQEQFLRTIRVKTKQRG